MKYYITAFSSLFPPLLTFIYTKKKLSIYSFYEDLLITRLSVLDSQITPIIILYNFLQSGGEVLDFYIFWKFGFCRTPPSLRQLFYPIVNLLFLSHLPYYLPISPSILLIPHLSPYFYSNIPQHSTHAPHPILSTLSPYSHPSLIHNLSTAFPQVKSSLLLVIHNPYLINRPFIYPFIPTYITISPIIPIIIHT